MNDAMLLDATGWPPEILDNTPEDRIQNLLTFKAVKNVVNNGGEI